MSEPALVARPTQRGDLILAASTVLPVLHAGLDDGCLEVRRRCLETIGLICAAMTRLVDESLGNAEPTIRPPLQAEYEELRPLLLALRDQGAILERFLHDNDPETRILTHRALEELGVARCALAASLRRQRTASRRKTAGCAAERGDAASVRGTGAPGCTSSPECSGCVGNVRAPTLPALPALTRALRDPDRFVRWSAVRTVGKLGPTAAPQTIDDLTRLLNDPDADLRKAAASALKHLQAHTEPRP